MRKTKFMFLILSSLCFSLFIAEAPPARAQETAPACANADRTCLLKALESEAALIENKSWRDQTYRELAKTLAFDGQTGQALALLPKIESPDTKAMTIRGIGMAAADLKLPKDQYDVLFLKLRTEASQITHLPSQAIALTYVAMAQAFAGDNEGAWATAASMENAALRHKAYGETAEIQAERGNAEAAMGSISKIDNPEYKNKAYTSVAKILADGKALDAALQAALKIDNAYKKAEAMQYILDAQKPREVIKQKD